MNSFEFHLFYNNLSFLALIKNCGINKLIIDWENKGKIHRQVAYDTQINYHTNEDLEQIADETELPIICRINGFPNFNEKEIEIAILNGVEEILLPMVRNPDEVHKILTIIDNRCKLGILVETQDAITNAKYLAELPLSRVYVGLNDLAIDTGRKNIFVPIIDGTIEKLRQKFDDIPFGFGGLTDPNLGYPIPCHLLINEMARLSCNFSFLRRSFIRDAKLIHPQKIVSNIRECIEKARKRSVTEIDKDFNMLDKVVRNYEFV